MRLTEVQKTEVLNLHFSCKNCQCFRCFSTVVNKRCKKCEQFIKDYIDRQKTSVTSGIVGEKE